MTLLPTTTKDDDADNDNEDSNDDDEKEDAKRPNIKGQDRNGNSKNLACCLGYVFGIAVGFIATWIY